MTDHKPKNKRAFTLVELIVVLALMSILGMALVSILVPTSNMYGTMVSRIDAKMRADQIMKTLVVRVRFADEMEIADSLDKLTQTWPNGIKLYSNAGRIYKSEAGTETDLFTEEYYDGYDVEVYGEKIENNLVELKCTVTLHNDSAIHYELVTAVEIFNAQTIVGSEGHILFYLPGQ